MQLGAEHGDGFSCAAFRVGPIERAAAAGDRVFVLPETDELALLDSQAASPERSKIGLSVATFSLAGSSDDDADGKRVSFGIADVTRVPTGDVTSAGAEIAVDGRPGCRVRE